MGKKKKRGLLNNQKVIEKTVIHVNEVHTGLGQSVKVILLFHQLFSYGISSMTKKKLNANSEIYSNHSCYLVINMLLNRLRKKLSSPKHNYTL